MVNLDFPSGGNPELPFRNSKSRILAIGPSVRLVGLAVPTVSWRTFVFAFPQRGELSRRRCDLVAVEPRDELEASVLQREDRPVYLWATR